MSPAACVAHRFFRFVEFDGECWRWTGAIDPQTGYGRLGVGRGAQNAHAVAYRLLVGDVPDGLELDHICRHRWCVNPRHLEPVTHRENLMRGDTIVRAHHEGIDCGYAGCKTCQRFQGAA